MANGRCKRGGGFLPLVGVLLVSFMGAFIPFCLGQSLYGSEMESERAALLALRAGNPDVATAWLSSWKGEDYCSWSGVGCDNTTGHVVQLHLRCPVVTGSPCLSKVTPSLIRLTRLKYMDLSMNNFLGASIPGFIGSLVNLEYLNLSNAGFFGAVPRQLGNLSNLHSLDLRSDINQLLDVDDLHWLSRISSLRYLDMSSNDLSNAIKWLHDVNMLSSLRVLRLSSANLPGIPTTLPHLNLSSLVTLDLSTNSFDTTIPRWLFNISTLENLALKFCSFHGELPAAPLRVDRVSLVTLALSYNSLKSTIPRWLFNITSLVNLHLYSNNFNGALSIPEGDFNSNMQVLVLGANNMDEAIPETLGNLNRLRRLDLSVNSIPGGIPESIRNLRHLEHFDISLNQITGGIPRSIGSLAQLKSLHLRNNSLSGGIPWLLKHCRSLVTLDFGENFLSGNVPPWIGESLLSLRVLRLRSNLFDGRIPSSVCEMPSLQVLDLSNNRLSEEIPRCWNKSLAQLKSLHLSNNRLSGGIPWLLKHCRSLVTLDFGENFLSGNVPPWIGESLLSLRVLRLRSNLFDGHIPVELSRLASLQVLDLAHNNLSGSLPAALGNLSAIVARDGNWDYYETNCFDINYFLPYYMESLLVTAKREQLEYTMILSLITSIDLSSNILSGGIPEELTSLHGLQFLNLSRNHFTGPIPETIGAMGQLVSLDLSDNDLTGSIPSNMSALNYLCYLNLSNNGLSGRIPSGGQFQTFDPSIYKGNYLCGWPLEECRGDGGAASQSLHTSNQEESGDGFEMIGLFSSSVLGFVVGIWGFVGAVTIKGSIRYAYFRGIDRMYFYLISRR